MSADAARILGAAVDLAVETGWDRLRLRDVAARLGISLAEVQAQFRDQNAIADALFAQAQAAMLAPPPPGFAELPAGERTAVVLMRWFDFLAPYRRLAGDMLRAKLYPSHPHHWAPMVFDLSRTIHWLRDAAMLDATGRRRQFEEVALTGLFLAALAVWQARGEAATAAFLRRRLTWLSLPGLRTQVNE